MHPGIESALFNTSYTYPALTAITLSNAEKLMNYIEDINLNSPEEFVPTPSQSLYILWSVEDWEFHMECVKNGSILYSFNKGGLEKASGNNNVDEFIAQLERYLLMGMA